MGGALPIQTNLRPDLVSATITNVDTVNGTETVRYVFDKAIGSQPTANQYKLGNYGDDGNTSADGSLVAFKAVTVGSTTVDATFQDEGGTDVSQYTYASAGSNVFGSELNAAANNLNNGQGNLPDSTALIGSSSINGTTGHTIAPDLTGITVNVGTQTINYIFDQKVRDTGGINAANFVAVDDQGTEVTADTVTVADNVVAAKFAGGSLTTATVKGYARAFAVEAVAGADETFFAKSYFNQQLVVNRPGSGGSTTAPDAQAALLVDNGNQVAFIYDQIVYPNGTNPQVITSSGLPLNTAYNTGAGTNTLLYDVDDIPGQVANEYFVAATAAPGSASNTPQNAVRGNTTFSTASGLPVGGNAGAKAAGFTTGPEALRVTFDNATNSVGVLFDQRFASADPTDFQLIDNTGNAIASPDQVDNGGGPFAGQVTATLRFTNNSGAVQGARGLLINAGGVTTYLGYGNTTQALSPTATAAVLKKGSKAKFKKVGKVSKAQKAKIARIKRSLR